MNCAWFRENVHAYAVGALDPGDLAQIEKHLDEALRHDGCFEALADALETVQVLDRSLPPVQPAQTSWDGVLRAIETPRNVVAMKPRPAPRWREAVAWGTALAAGLALFFMYRAHEQLEVRLHEGDRQLARLADAEENRLACRTALEQSRTSSEASREVLALLDRPGTRVVSFAPQGGHRESATAVVDAGGTRAYFVSAALPSAAGKDYELWVIRGAAAPEPAGFVRVAAGGGGVGEFDAKLLEGGNANALAVSIEPAGGRPSPTEVILVAKL